MPVSYEKRSLSKLRELARARKLKLDISKATKAEIATALRKQRQGRVQQSGGSLMNTVSKLNLSDALAAAKKFVKSAPLKNTKLPKIANIEMYGGGTRKLLDNPLIQNYCHIGGIQRVYDDTEFPVGILGGAMIQAGQNKRQVNAKIREHLGHKPKNGQEMVPFSVAFS